MKEKVEIITHKKYFRKKSKEKDYEQYERENNTHKERKNNHNNIENAFFNSCFVFWYLFHLRGMKKIIVIVVCSIDRKMVF